MIFLLELGILEFSFVKISLLTCYYRHNAATNNPSSLRPFVCPCPDLTEARDIGTVSRERSRASSVNSNSCHQSEDLVTAGSSLLFLTRPDTRSLTPNRREGRGTYCPIFCPLKCYERFKKSVFVYLNFLDGEETSNNLTVE